MNRYKAFFAAALVAIVVACDTDRVANNGIEQVPLSPQYSVANTGTLKIHIGSADYALVDQGDYIASFGSDSFSAVFAGVPKKFAASSVASDTTGAHGTYSQGGCSTGDGYLVRQAYCLSTFLIATNDSAYWSHIRSGNGVTVDTIMLNNVYSSGGAPDSIRWRISGALVDGSSYSQIFDRGQDMKLDNVGSVKYDYCTASPTCTWGPIAPTGATLTNVVQYAKVTWSNNGNTKDSTEIWFGDVSNPTLRETVGPGTTQGFETWLSGSHQYIAKVRHVRAGLQSAYSISNTITR